MATEQQDQAVSRPSGALLARNTVYNVIGLALPMVVAVVATPLVVRGLGVERFGTLSICWMVVAYFSLFDIGIGRATTKFVSEYIARGDWSELPVLIWTALWLLLGLGLAGGLVLFFMAPLLAGRILHVPEGMVAETGHAFRVLAFSIPVVVSAAGLQGILAAQQRFRTINFIQAPGTAFTYLAPLGVLPFTNRLDAVVAALVVIRAVIALAFVIACLRSIPGLARPHRLQAAPAKLLLGFGGWLALSSVIDPFMTYLDRFMIGAALTMGAVAYYTTAYDLITKLFIIVGALTNVLFPAFSAFSAEKDDAGVVCSERLRPLYNRGIRYVLLIYAPIVFLAIGVARPFFKLWLGPEFALQSTPVLQILAVGVLINASARIPFIAIQALRRPDLTTKLQLIEFPLYLCALWLFLSRVGIVGAALAWLLRVTLDAVLLFVLAHRLIPRPEADPTAPGRDRWLALCLGAGALVALAFGLSRSFDLPLLAGAITLVLAGTVAAAWLSLDRGEQASLKRIVCLSKQR